MTTQKPCDGRTSVATWWLCLIVAPLALAGIELYHPAGFTHDPGGMWAYLSRFEPRTPQHKALGYPGPQWWFTLHMIQTPLVGLVCLGLWQMVRDVGAGASAAARVAAGISRVATFLTFVYFTALDAIGGFGLGRTMLVTQEMLAARELSLEQADGVAAVMNRIWVDPWVGGVGSFVSQVASWSVFVAAAAAGLALLLSRRAPLLAALMLAFFGWELQLSHAAMHGPAAFALLAVTSFWLWLRSRGPSTELAR